MISYPYLNIYVEGAALSSDVEQCELLDDERTDYVLRSDDQSHLFDQLANEILATKAMKRLGNIGFLGAIDYLRKGNGKSAHRRKHNRLEHSVGVALLAQKFSLSAELPHIERLKLIAASLLHDIGHGPLSHTLEPVFEEDLDIEHHKATETVIKGDSIFGREILDILASHALDVNEIIALINGKHTGPYAYLFSGKINLDTLEGITRCRAIVGRRAAFGTALAVVDRWAKSGKSNLPKADFDEFWKLKHDVYALLINSPMGLTMDTVAQAWTRENISKIEASDFYMNEKQLRRKHPELFQLIRLAAHDQKELRATLPDKWLKSDVQARRRAYYVDDTVELDSISDMTQRYKYEKKSWTISLGEIIGE